MYTTQQAADEIQGPIHCRPNVINKTSTNTKRNCIEYGWKL